MKHASALVAVLARNLTSATSKGHFLQISATSPDGSAVAQSESADQDSGNLHARHAHYSFIMIIFLMTLFIFVTLSLTGAMLAFCRKKNSVFTHYDGVATTSAEFGGCSVARFSMDGSSEFELGDFDSDGEGMCGAPDRGQCYYQLGHEDSEDTDDEFGLGEKSCVENSPDKSNKTEKHFARNKSEMRGEKKEVVLSIQNSEGLPRSKHCAVRFPRNRKFLEKNFTTRFKFSDKKEHKHITVISNTTTTTTTTNNNNNHNDNNNKNYNTSGRISRSSSRSAVKSQTFPLDLSDGLSDQAGASPNGAEHGASSNERECHRAALLYTSSQPCRQLVPTSALHPNSRTQTRQLNGTGNINFKGGRRSQHAVCANPNHNHFRRKRGKRSGHELPRPGNQIEAGSSRHQRQGQGLTYQARIYRRLQEQRTRLTRNPDVESSIASGHWSCALRQQCRSHYQMRELKRCHSDPYGNCGRLHRSLTIHAIPQTGPESIADTAASAADEDDVCGGGGGIRHAGVSCELGIRGYRTSSKCGVTIVRVEHPPEFPPDSGRRSDSTNFSIDYEFDSTKFGTSQFKKVSDVAKKQGHLSQGKPTSSGEISAPDKEIIFCDDFTEEESRNSNDEFIKIVEAADGATMPSRNVGYRDEVNRKMSCQRTDTNSPGNCALARPHAEEKQFDDVYLLPDASFHLSCGQMNNLSVSLTPQTSVSCDGPQTTNNLDHQEIPSIGSLYQTKVIQSASCFLLQAITPKTVEPSFMSTRESTQILREKNGVHEQNPSEDERTDKDNQWDKQSRNSGFLTICDDKDYEKSTPTAHSTKPQTLQQPCLHPAIISPSSPPLPLLLKKTDCYSVQYITPFSHPPLDVSEKHHQPLSVSVDDHKPLYVNGKHHQSLDVSEKHDQPLDVSGKHHKPLDVSEEHHQPLDVSGKHHQPLNINGEHHQPLDVSENHHQPLDISGKHHQPTSSNVPTRIPAPPKSAICRRRVKYSPRPRTTATASTAPQQSTVNHASTTAKFFANFHEKYINVAKFAHIQESPENCMLPFKTINRKVINSDKTFHAVSSGPTKCIDTVSFDTEIDSVLSHRDTEGLPASHKDSIMSQCSDGSPASHKDSIMSQCSDGSPASHKDSIMSQCSDGLPVSQKGSETSRCSDGLPASHKDSIMSQCSDGLPASHKYSDTS